MSSRSLLGMGVGSEPPPKMFLTGVIPPYEVATFFAVTDPDPMPPDLHRHPLSAQ